MQRPPLFESDSFIYWKNRFETYVKSKDLDLWHVITIGDFQPIEQNSETKLDEVIPFEKQSDDLKKRLAENNEAKMVIYNALPRKEYERIFMCNTPKEIWKSLLITHQGNSQVKDNKIDLLVQQYEQFVIFEDEFIDNAFARFNTIITSLKALDEGYSSKNYVRKFLRALHPKWRAKVTTIEESKDLTSLSFDELIECSTSGSKDKEYAMTVKDFKKFFKRRECPKPPKDKNQRAFVRGSWSDSGEEDDEKNVNPPPTNNHPVLLVALRAKAVQELHEPQVISAFVDYRLESIERFLNSFNNQTNETDINNIESEDESLDTPLVSPFPHSDNDSDDGEVLNELREYENAEILRRERIINSFDGNDLAFQCMIGFRKFDVYLDPFLLMNIISQVLMGKPFIKITKLEYDVAKGLVSFTKIFDTYIFRMPRTMPRLRNFKWSKIAPLLELSQRGLMNGLRHPYEKNKFKVTLSEHNSEIIKDGKVIGKGIKKKGLYVMKLGNKQKEKICLATIDENFTLWHRRLGYANMRLIQSLAFKELVRYLPRLKFDQHFCDACKIGKQAHTSYKAKNIVSTIKCLELLHMDLLSPSSVRSYEGNLYTLVIVDDYSRLLLNSKAYIILNKQTMKIKELLNMTFDETPPPSKTSPLVDDDLDEEEAIKVTEKKNLENDIEDETFEIDEIVNIREFRNHPLKNVIENLNQRTLRNKLDGNGVVSQNKARLVAQGYNQQEGIDYDETYAPVARLESIRILLAYARALDFRLFQMDVKSAFLNSFINDEVYATQPPGSIDFEKPDYVYMCDEFAKIIHGEFEMSMMGELNFFLGLQIKQMKDGIFFNQSKYIKEMLEKFGLEDSKPMKTLMSSDVGIQRLHDDVRVTTAQNPNHTQDLLVKEKMESQSEPAQTMSALKLSVLKTGEYELWSIRMERYLTFIDHALWEVIVNGDSVSPVASASAGAEGPIPPKTAEQKLARKNKLKVLGIIFELIRQNNETTRD
nr:copia protein [Tanacetum cinerariifolium]